MPQSLHRHYKNAFYRLSLILQVISIFSMVLNLCAFLEEYILGPVNKLVNIRDLKSRHKSMMQPSKVTLTHNKVSVQLVKSKVFDSNF